MGTTDNIVQSAPTLPSAEEAFGKDESNKLPSADEAFGSGETIPRTAHPFINSLFSSMGAAATTMFAEHIVENKGEIPSVLTFVRDIPSRTYNFAKQGLESGEQLVTNVAAGPTSEFPGSFALNDEQRQVLKNSGLYDQGSLMHEKIRNDGEPLTKENYKDLLANDIMNSPAGQFGNLAIGVSAPLAAVFSPLFEFANKTAQGMGASKGDINLAMAAMTISAVAHAKGKPEEVTQALEHHVIGSPESTFMGETPPTPVMSEVASKSAAVNAPPEPAPEAIPEPLDINKTARNIAPEVFEEYDALGTKQEALRHYMRNGEEVFGKEVDDKISDLEKQREELTRAPTNLEPEELLKAVSENNAKGAEIDAEIKRLKDSREEYIKSSVDAAREEFMKADYRRRDLAPSVSAAYRAAEEFHPENEVKDNIPVVPADQTKIGEADTAEEHPATAPTNRIAENLSKDLQTLGRPEEEANASASLVAAHYQAIADMGWAKGTAEEIYMRESPTLKEGRQRVLKRREFAQSGRGSILFADGEVPLIKFFKRADASTFIHETGHAWLDEMERFAKEPDAPQSLLDSLKIVRDWLKVNEGEEIARKEHEKFARGFERYMMEGVAPSRGLAQVFAKFKEWLTKIYQTVNKLRSPITDDIRDVFDRLLSANPEKTVIAPDHEPGKMAADIHEADAKTTEPKEKDRIGDTVEKEIDTTAKLHEPEVADAIKTAETGNVSEQTPGNTENAIPSESTGEGGITKESGTIAAGGGESQTGSAGLRPETSERSGTPNGTADARPNTEIARPRSDLIDKAGNIRLDLLTKPGDVSELIRQMADENDGYVDAQGSAITHREMADFAQDLGVEEKALNIETLKEMTRVDGIPLAFRIRAARAALVQSANDLQKMMANAERASEEDILKYAEAKSRHIMIGKTVSGITSEWGRAGHAFRDISDDEMKAAQDVTEYLQSATGRSAAELRQEMVLGSKLQTRAQVSKYVKESSQPTFVDKMLWYRNMCLLSGPVTHGVYMEANFINLITRPLLEVPVQAKLGELRGAIERVYSGEAKEMLYALGPASARAFSNAVESWKEQTQVMPGAQGIKKYTTLVGQQQMIGGKLGTALNAVGRTIGALHSFVYTLAYEQNIAALSFRQAMKEGLDPDSTEFAARVNELKTNQTPEMMDASSTSALNEMNMGKSGKVLGLLSATINSNPVGKFLFPFIKMEINVKKQRFLERTPLGFLSKDIRANLMGVNGELARDLQQGKMLAMTGTAAAVFTLASQFINADGPSDPNKNRVWRLTHTPNSIQIGSTAFSLKALGNLGSLLQMGAAMHESLSGWEGEDGDHAAAAFAEKTSKVISEGSFAESLKNTLEFAFNPSRNASQFVQNFATQFLPFSVGLGQVTKVIDPFQKDTRTEDVGGAEGAAKNILKAALARIPGASYLIHDKYDMFGNPIAQNSDYYDRYKDDSVVQRMNALHMAVGRLDTKIFGVRLNDDQYAEYSRISGVLTKETLDRLVTPSFANAPLVQQVKSIHDVIGMGREQAKQIVMTKYPEIRDKAVDFQKKAHGY